MIRTTIASRLTVSAAALGTIFLLALSIALTGLIAVDHSTWIETAFPFYASAFGASAIVLAIKLEPTLKRSHAMVAVGAFLGKTSYSMYLFHLLVLSALSARMTSLDWPAMLLIYLATTAIVATAMYTAVEAPILAMRPRFVREN
jgi:peptidoglycan/LPS O-acetylase OafA/YrhL